MSRDKNILRWKSVRKYKKVLTIIGYNLGYRGKILKQAVEAKLDLDLERFVKAREAKLGPWAGISYFNRYRNFREGYWQYSWQKHWTLLPKLSDIPIEELISASIGALSAARACVA